MAVSTSHASASLYVGDIASDVTEALLFEIFNAVGPVASVRVCRDAATRRSLGYAYVNFHRMDDAERALDTMNFKNIRDQPCRIMWSHRDPSLRKSGLGNVFVKNLAPSIDNKSLYDTFSMFGNILSCKVSTNAKGESLGYGFVHYENDEDARQAIARVNGKVIAGQQVLVAPFRSKKERGMEGSANSFTNVYVKNVAEGITEEKLQELFTKFGKITSLKLAVGPEGKSKGFGFINFGATEEAARAVEEMNNFELEGKQLFVGRAQRKDEREKELRERFEQLKVERQKKYEGVNLYVKNLADDITDERLREEFKQFGDITSCKIMTESSGKSKGFGFVCFATPEEATKAVTEMTGKMLDSKPLYVSLAQRKEVRRAQLEAQHNQRGNKMGGVPPQIFPGPQGGPMFYAPGVPPRNFMYPAMVPRRGWQGGNPPPQMMVGPSGVNFQLMPVPQGGRNPQGRQGQNRGRRSQQGVQKQGNAGPRRQQQQQQQQQQQLAGRPTAQQPEPETAAVVTGPQPLTIKALAAAPEGQQKQMIGERLYPLVQAQDASRAGKITGMLLEMDNGELIHLLESEQALSEKVAEAIAVLEQAGVTVE